MGEAMADYTEKLARNMLYFAVVGVLVIGLLAMSDSFIRGIVVIFVAGPCTILAFGFLSVIISIRKNLIEINAKLK